MIHQPWERHLPWIVVAIAVVYLGTLMIPTGGGARDFDFAGYGSMPVKHRGRVQPMDTLARTSLMVISGKQTYLDEKGKTQPAIRWLLDVINSTPSFAGDEAVSDAFKHKVFRIENEEVLRILELRPRSGFRYSIEEIQPKFKAFLDRANKAKVIDAKKRELFDVKLIELAEHLQIFQELASHRIPLAIPPLVHGGGDPWVCFADVGEFLKEGQREWAQHPPVLAYYNLKLDYQKGDPKAFNEMVVEYGQWLEKNYRSEQNTANLEVFFNRFAPFYYSAVLYVFVMLLAILSWLTAPYAFGRAAFWLGVLTLCVHTWALITRMVIQGRPPVTNLYSSAVFIGWGCVGLGLFLEYIYRNGVGSVVAALTGSLSLMIAHYLSLSGDTLEMLQAVLDTNFWLATHVTCVTLGYTATFVAGFLGIFYVITGVATPYLTRERMQNLTRMIYGVVCFATLLSFTGTVLGGIWADQSWGRFWGWDPKENGALLIVLWNALLLHARWGGMVKPRGIAVLAILGNIVTAWSWFGVNMLGVGLHAYGFMHGAVWWLLAFVFSQLFIAGVGLLPLSLWRSFAMPQRPTAPPAEQPIKEAPVVRKDAILSGR